jgi:hypothetical protein
MGISNEAKNVIPSKFLFFLVTINQKTSQSLGETDIGAILIKSFEKVSFNIFHTLSFQ